MQLKPKGGFYPIVPSGTCEGGWQLNVTSGEQRQLDYFSSDWTYRNDADVVRGHSSFSVFLRFGCFYTDIQWLY